MKMLPNYIYSKKHKTCTNILFVVALVFAIISLIIPNIWVSLIMLVILIAGIMVVLALSNPLINAEEFIEKKGNFSEYEKRINEILNNNISPESRNFINIKYSNSLYLVHDKSKGYALFNKCTIPHDKKYHIYYYLIKFYHLLSNDKLEEAIKLRNSGVIKNKKLLKKLDVLIDIHSGKDILDIEKLLPIKTKNMVTRVSNLCQLMNYYKTKDEEKAKEYAKLILNQNTDFKWYNNKALEIIEKTAE